MARGEIARPSTENVRRIAIASRVSLDWLLLGDADGGSDEGAHHMGGHAPERVGYGDTDADELVRWLDLPATRRQIPSVEDRVRRAVDVALQRSFSGDDWDVLYAWVRKALDLD
jgi:hypothetical protein